jgi:hypothetical protein
MQFFGLIITTNKKFRQKIDEARKKTIQYDLALISRLLYNAEKARQIAESALRKPVRFEEDIRPRIADRLNKNRLERKDKN